MVTLPGPSPRRLIVAGLALLWAAAPADADSIRSRLTRKDDMNAVRYNGQVWTIQDLIDRRAQAPGRFDANHERLGRALSLGLDGLQARRGLNTARFDRYHPVLGYLLTDLGTGQGAQGGPDLPPDVLGPVVPTDGGAAPQTPVPPLPPFVPPAIPPSEVAPPEASGFEPPPPIEIPPPPSGGELPEPPDTPAGPELPTPGPLPPGPGPVPDLTPAQVVPEPPGLLQLLVGMAGLSGALALRRRRAAS